MANQDSANDWQQMSPAWREWEIHRCLCGILDILNEQI